MVARIYTPGRQISDPQKVFGAILAGQPLYFNDRVQVAGWSQNFRIGNVAKMAKSGQVREALVRSESFAAPDAPA